MTEVGRQQFVSEEWSSHKNKTYGMMMATSQSFEQPVEPGTYRIEVSTPTNQGKYLLHFGQGVEEGGYFHQLQSARVVQKFYGYSVVKLLTSSLVYYPLGILFLLFLLQRIWRYRTILKNHVG